MRVIVAGNSCAEIFRVDGRLRPCVHVGCELLGHVYEDPHQVGPGHDEDRHVPGTRLLAGDCFHVIAGVGVADGDHAVVGALIFV